MQSKSNQTGMGVGGSSILMIFVLLCMTTFAALSLVSANADRRLTVKTAEAAAAYYEADCLAEEKLGEVDKILTQSGAGGVHAVLAALRAVEGVTAREEGETVLIDFQIPCGEERALMVRLAANPGKPAGGGIEVAYWKIVSLRNPDEYEEQAMNLVGTAPV